MHEFDGTLEWNMRVVFLLSLHKLRLLVLLLVKLLTLSSIVEEDHGERMILGLRFFCKQREILFSLVYKTEPEIHEQIFLEGGPLRLLRVT